jgi:hypothetical protein
MTDFFEDPSGFWRDVDVPVDTDVARSYGERRIDAVESLLDHHVARGAISSRSDWRPRLRREFEFTSEILDSLPGDDAEAGRAFQRDERIRALGDQNDAMMRIREEDGVREFSEDAALPESERNYRQFARMTNESVA